MTADPSVHIVAGRAAAQALADSMMDEKLRKVGRLDDLVNDANDSPDLAWPELYPWPVLDSAALYGVAGRFVRLVGPSTEADPAALLTQLLAAIGCAMGPSAYVEVGSIENPARLFMLLIGRTSSARKGSSWVEVRRLLKMADEDWLNRCETSGMASGEALVARFSGDGGLVEKRALVVEGEFESILAVKGRAGSTLSAMFRDLYDRAGTVRNTTKKDPQAATGCHVGVIAHVTATELREKLPTTDISNGFLNRFITICARRSKVLAFPKRISSADLAPIAKDIRTAIDNAQHVRCVNRTGGANAIYGPWYNDLAAQETESRFDALVARAADHVNRLSLIYALLDGEQSIGVNHINAALSVWRYAHDSAQYLFGEALGDPTATTILTKLREIPGQEVTLSTIRGLWSNHKPAKVVDVAIASLVKRDLIELRYEPTGGRPTMLLRAMRSQA
jgi:hypothetical protein